MTRGRREWITGALLFALAAALRAAYVASVADEPSVRYPSLDALAYHRWALAIQEGEWLGDRIYYQDPIYPLFLAGLYTLFGAGSIGVLFAQCALDAASVVLLYATALTLFGFVPALVAGVIASGYVVFLFYVALLLKAPLLLFLFNLAFYLLVRAATGRDFRWWLAAGLALGLAALARGNAMLFVPLLLLWIALDRESPQRRRLGNAAAVSAGILLALAPVTLRNYAVGGELVVLNSQGGQNFYIGNFRGNNSGTYRKPPFLRASPIHEEEDFKRAAEQATGRKMTPSEVSSYWWRRGLEEIRADPGHFLRHTLRKLRLLVNHHELADNYSFNFVAEVGAPMLRWPLPSYAALFPLALCGAVFARRRRGVVLLLAFWFAYAASLIMFFNLSRLRLPLVPLVIVFGAFALVEIAQRLRARQLRAAAPALLFLLLAYPVVYADVVPDRQGNMYINLAVRHTAVASDHQRRATVLLERGEELAALDALELARNERAQAEKSYRRGLEKLPNNRQIHEGLRGLVIIRITNLVQLKQYGRAVLVAEQLTRAYPSHAPGYVWLGLAHARLGHHDKSTKALERALELDPENTQARRELLLLRRSGS
jgi:4-amino-4-deoxy-L-arabinose transferase-like glycosyltransferase